MTKPLIWAGFIATLVMAGVMAIYTVREPARQEKAQAALIDESVTAATDLYAENCATCHGRASGRCRGWTTTACAAWTQ
jgi:mono/diheme cytochrome c family protein